jgi:transposase
VSVEAWAQDEHRVGLKSIVRRVWAPKGTRPMAAVKEKDEWLYVYAFVHPTSGRTHWLLLPTVNSQVMSLALADFATAVGAGPTKHILLVLDQAGWHMSQEVVIPEGIELLPLPSHSPELQPAERLWPLTNEAVANRSFASLDELDQVLGERCVTLAEMPDLVRAYTHYRWWPTDA